MSKSINQSQSTCLPRLLLLALLSLAAFTTVSAQGVGTGRDLSNTGGNHTITGRVYFPTQPTDDVRIKIRLESNFAPTLTTSTNADGVFRFSGLTTGYYQLIVDAGDQYEAVREQINIDRGNTYSPRNVQVPIYLRPKGAPAANKAGAINATMLGDAPKSAVDLYTKASEAAGKGDPRKAVDLLNKALEIHPKFPLALSDLGVQYLKLAQPDKAAEALQAALKLTPDEVGPRLNYGIALLNLRKFDEAEKELREVIKRNDGLPTAHMYLGIVLMSKKQLDDAEQELLKAATSKSTEVASAHRYLGGIYWGKREYKKAADELETYLKLAPKAPDAEKTQAAIKELRSKQ